MGWHRSNSSVTLWSTPLEAFSCASVFLCNSLAAISWAASSVSCTSTVARACLCLVNVARLSVSIRTSMVSSLHISLSSQTNSVDGHGRFASGGLILKVPLRARFFVRAILLVAICGSRAVSGGATVVSFTGGRQGRFSLPWFWYGAVTGFAGSQAVSVTFTSDSDPSSYPLVAFALALALCFLQSQARFHHCFWFAD
jgi:hypothetical protein